MTCAAQCGSHSNYLKLNQLPGHTSHTAGAPQPHVTDGLLQGSRLGTFSSGQTAPPVSSAAPDPTPPAMRLPGSYEARVLLPIRDTTTALLQRNLDWQEGHFKPGSLQGHITHRDLVPKRPVLSCSGPTGTWICTPGQEKGSARTLSCSGSPQPLPGHFGQHLFPGG